MISIKIPTGATAYLREMVPPGTECYVVGKRGQQYLNVRTHDAELIAKLKAATHDQI